VTRAAGDHRVTTPALTSHSTPPAGYRVRSVPAREPAESAPAPLVRDDGSVIIPAALVPAVRRMVVDALTARQRADGGALSPDAHRFLRALRTAAEARNRPRASASSDRGTTPVQAGTVNPDTVGCHGLVSASEAADLLGSSTEWVRRLARAGRLPAHRVGTQWLIDRAALDDYRHGRTDERSTAA